MDPIPLEDLALLEVLLRIDRRAELLEGDTEIVGRLTESGLVEEVEDGDTALTAAGVELSKSLQHRVAAGEQAERVLDRREESAAVDELAPERARRA